MCHFFRCGRCRERRASNWWVTCKVHACDAVNPDCWKMVGNFRELSCGLLVGVRGGRCGQTLDKHVAERGKNPWFPLTTSRRLWKFEILKIIIYNKYNIYNIYNIYMYVLYNSLLAKNPSFLWSSFPFRPLGSLVVKVRTFDAQQPKFKCCYVSQLFAAFHLPYGMEQAQ